MSRKCIKCIHDCICGGSDDPNSCEYYKEKRPHGEWTSNSHDLELFCSVCGGALPYSDEYTYETDFCPNCGADMRKEGEAE